MTEPERETPRPILASAVQILGVFLVASLIMWVGRKVVGEDSFKRQVVAWVANVAMLIAVWLDLRDRGQTWKQLGPGTGPLAPTRKNGRHTLAFQPILVFGGLGVTGNSDATEEYRIEKRWNHPTTVRRQNR